MTKIIRARVVSKTSKLEILGHVFNGLSNMKKAVKSYCRIGQDSWKTEPKSPIEGVHVICIYEPYPCFNSEDYANEDRDYSSYFFQQSHLQNIRLNACLNFLNGLSWQYIIKETEVK